jgi:hypothetical protein
VQRGLVAMAVVLGLAGFAPRARAQAGGAGTAPASPSATAQHVVVIADAADNETDNARLRAVVFDVARGYGLSAERPPDLVETARTSGALEGGRVSTAVAPLGSLRQAFGASVLVRISREWERGADVGLRVTVVGPRGSESEVVSAPNAEPEPALEPAVKALLEKVLGKAPASTASSGPSTGGGAASGAASSGASAGVQWLVNPASAPPAEPHDRRSIARAWAARGGVRATYEVRGMLTTVMIPHQGFSSENPVTHATESGQANTFGVGGGVGVRVGMLYLPLGDPRISSGTFAAFRLGAGIDGSVLYARPPSGYDYQVSGSTITGRDTAYADRAWLYGVASAQLGLHVGIGSYKTQTIWRGVLLGVAYSPAFLYQLDIASLSGSGKLNPAGVEADLDLASLKAQKDVTAESQIRLSAFLMPRVRSDLPWLLQLGLGAAWY